LSDMRRPVMANIGCGATYHPDWVNIDVAPSDSSVLAMNVGQGLPFEHNSVDVCYSSHVLEHFPKDRALDFIGECHRVLRSSGLIRIVVPDLEGIVRQYLAVLDAVVLENTAREADYDWILLEIYDQAVRNHSGGEMSRFLSSPNLPNMDFISSRIGAEAENFQDMQTSKKSYRYPVINSQRLGRVFNFLRETVAGWLVYLFAGRTAYQNFQVGLFRGSGEIHQWMYDRYSLKRLLEMAGFREVKVCTSTESSIPDFQKYSLDTVNGKPRKPDSLYVEGRKP